MATFKAISGQTLADVCLNTYGSMDYFYKLLQDNGVPSADFVPYTNVVFTYDETLVVDTAINKTTTLGNIVYATNYANTENTYYITTVGGLNLYNPTISPTPFVPTSPTYQKTSATDYTSISVAGEDHISLPTLQGKTIIQVEKNIQPLTLTEWNWNPTTYTLVLQDKIYTDEKLFIIFTEMISV